MAHKYVYLFTEGNAKMRELLGGKGANLAEMTNIAIFSAVIFASIAQSVEQETENLRVGGSIPPRGTNLLE